MPQVSPSDTATKSLPLYVADIVWVKFAHPTNLLTTLTKHACHYNSFWGSSCDSNHAPTISLKPIPFHGDFGNSFRHVTQVLSRHTSSLTSDHPRYFELFRPYFLQNLHISANPYQNKPFQASNTNILKTSQNVQKLSTTLWYTRNQVSTLSLPKY